MIQTGATFGNYNIVRQLGAGGMSDVYEAIDLTLERHVALKIMPAEFSQDEERIKRFRKEVLAVAALDHPGIVTIFEVNRANGYDYYSMSLARHGNLKQLIHKGSLNPRRGLRILTAVAEALAHAHEQGIVHRDIKPENILFARPDQPMLADFGAVKWLGSDTDITAVGTSVGTPYYMSPEQAQAIKVDPRSDIYSLGVVLFEMLNGALPYDATTSIGVALQHVNDPVPKLPGGLSAMQPLIGRMMAKKPGARFQDCRALMEAIDRLQAELAQRERGAGVSEDRTARATAPPTTRDRSRKATAPPPTRQPKAAAPAPAKSPTPTASPTTASLPDPATEFDLMVITPDPEGASPLTTDEGEAEQEAKPKEKPPAPAPADRDSAGPSGAPAAGDFTAPAPPEAEPTAATAPTTAPVPAERRCEPSRTGSGAIPDLSPAEATDRPKPPRRRVNIGTPPTGARSTERWRACEVNLPVRVAWYRRPLTCIIGSALVALGVAVVVLLLKMAAPDREPSPVELITGGGGPDTRVIGGDASPSTASDEPTPRAPDRGGLPAPPGAAPGDPEDEANETVPTATASTETTPPPDASKTEFLNRLPDEPLPAGADAPPPALEPETDATGQDQSVTAETDSE